MPSPHAEWMGSSVGRAPGVMIQGVARSNRAPSTKLYAVGRRDLSPGLRTAQIGHALISWVLARGRPPDNLVVLEVPGLAELEALATRLGAGALGFREPDLNDELTAIAVDPGLGRELRDLPLMG